MQKIVLINRKQNYSLWNKMWNNRTITEELKTCKIELAPKLMFLKYLSKDDKIIDGGCGFGKWVLFLNRNGYDIMGVDSTELVISKLNDYNGNVHVEVGNILDLKYPDNSFDAYISMGVIEHFREGPFKALKEAHRILKPNGLLFVSTPTVNILRKIFFGPLLKILYKFPSLIEIIKLILKVFKQSDIINKKNVKNGKEFYFHFLEYRFTISELQGFLKQTDFSVIKTIPHDLFGSNDHAIGLTIDFPFLKKKGGNHFELNFLGKILYKILNSISPWIISASVLCVAKANK